MFDQFLQERVYLKGISPETQRFYQGVRVAFQPILAEPTKAGAFACIQRLRDKGVKPISINSYLCGFNAYLHWKLGTGEKCSPQCGHLRIPRLKEEQKIIATLTPEQMARLISFKPKGVNETRTHMAALLILDGGYRISELLELPCEGCDFQNLVVKVRGKGNRHRLVPLSVEMRKHLYRYSVKHSGPGRLIFGTRRNTLVTVRNFERDLKMIGRKLGITGVRFSPHTLRHTFAVQYLRAGGNLFYLSKILGHTSVTTTQRYLQSVGVDDLKAVHDRLSPLAPERLSAWR